MNTKFVYPVIDLTATGAYLKELLEERGVTVQDIQGAMGLASPQAVYRWLRGSNLPSVENLYALSRYLDVQMEDVLVEQAHNAKNTSREQRNLLPARAVS